MCSFAAAFCTGKGDVAMSTSIVSEIPPLSGDLVPWISDSGALMLLARVQNVQFTVEQDQGLAVETGRVTLAIVESLSDSSVSPGGTIVVPAKRIEDEITRVRNAFDHWNVLPLLRNDLVIVAVRRTATPGLDQALAARQVDSPSDPLVQGIRQAYALERFSGSPEAREGIFAAALTGPNDVFNEYAVDALQRRTVLGRQTGARLIALATASNGAGSDRRLQLAESLTELLDPERRADETNVLIVRTVAQALASDPDPEERSRWAMYLAAVLLKEFATDPLVDRQWRSALIRSVDSPAPDNMISILSGLEQRDRDDDQVRALLRAWRTANREN